MYAGRIVTPSRVCELKLKMRPNLPELILSHPHGCVSWNNLSERESRLLSVTPSRVCELKCGSFITLGRKTFVTPSRVCELKCLFTYFSQAVSKSHPHGCVSWNLRVDKRTGLLNVTPSRVCELKWLEYLVRGRRTKSHTLTGVWVEILPNYSSDYAYLVTPSRVCELK